MPCKTANCLGAKLLNEGVYVTWNDFVGYSSISNIASSMS